MGKTPNDSLLSLIDIPDSDYVLTAITRLQSTFGHFRCNRFILRMKEKIMRRDRGSKGGTEDGWIFGARAMVVDHRPDLLSAWALVSRALCERLVF